MASQRTILTSRRLVKVFGEDAKEFLQNLVSCDISEISATSSAFGALLSPQGKILWDFIVFADESTGGFLIDVSADELDAFAKRLGFYKLRAKVTVEPADETMLVIADWGDDLPADKPRDPRHADMGVRYVSSGEAAETASEADYHAHRIQLGIPQSGLDFQLADVFPHDTDMDSLNGVAFSKGCFIGQEVVSRMKHRGTARKRIIKVSAESALPAAGSDVLAGEKSVGTLGSSQDTDGLALLRLDRVKIAMDAGVSLTCDGVPLTPSIQEWASFNWPSSD
ncbi:CAF17-like 4Fe-4S cluster assembly/insertion protein YgfZ [Pseudovibrio sp. WM33]|uniref:CAF17-like 4Fe-4S cluster assembly/insertion protein YgfZ n=1 Tax=Pseudovibrio sp. WM33 TaxID=1735585 RepID=UPI0007AE6F50|nr:folate-binding protein YgfZ [Pseudovibrio sp. WM33]KZL29355.1 tRNA-modifying protein YgfZ [Pseudovibrio sp. WM33]